MEPSLRRAVVAVMQPADTPVAPVRSYQPKEVMPSRAPLCAWIAACSVLVPIAAAAQERLADEIVEAIGREGPRAIAIRAAVDVVSSRHASHFRIRVWRTAARVLASPSSCRSSSRSPSSG